LDVAVGDRHDSPTETGRRGAAGEAELGTPVAALLHLGAETDPAKRDPRAHVLLNPDNSGGTDVAAAAAAAAAVVGGGVPAAGDMNICHLLAEHPNSRSAGTKNCSADALERPNPDLAASGVQNARRKASVASWLHAGYSRHPSVVAPWLLAAVLCELRLRHPCWQMTGP